MAIESIDGLEPLLLEVLSHENPDLEMPQGKLPASVIGDFRRWIEGGAHGLKNRFPRQFRQPFLLQSEKRRNEHWCWQPNVNPNPPSLANNQSVRRPLDAFVQSALAKQGILPSLPADRRTWIRRVYFDLIGLPPSTDEIKAFLDDSDPDAFDKVVDKLLVSPHFGEKWARHWMDLVRYAETCGHEFDYPLEHPHEYRDYLIRAFNDDLPYDQLLVEHVAGDLLDEPRLNAERVQRVYYRDELWHFHEAVHAPTDPAITPTGSRTSSMLGKPFLV